MGAMTGRGGRGGRGGRAVAVAAALGLALAACGAPQHVEQDAASAGTAAAASGSVSVAGCRPYAPLTPGNTMETCGLDVLRAVLSMLVRYDGSGKAVNDIASSITTKDAKTFTIKLRSGVKFHDGTTVKAANFVDAWNFAAYGPNQQSNAAFLSTVRGYGATRAGDEKTLSGLKKVDDSTFTVTLVAPDRTFPQALGMPAFAPLPASFFQDKGKAFGKKPVGAGPYKVISADPATKFVLEASPGYTRGPAAKVKTVTIRVYSSLETAYSDLRARRIHLMSSLPSSALATYEKDLAGRVVKRDIGLIQTLNFQATKRDPSYGSPKLRQAISLAIDRGAINRGVFGGTRTPAKGWVGPGVSGYRAGGCGTLCTYDPVRAKRLYKEAGGHSGAIVLNYNADGGHREWVLAACASIKKALGATCTAKGVASFDRLLDATEGGTMKGMYRQGWLMDYPSIENYLAPLYGAGGPSNYGGYANKAFDDKLKAAAAKATVAEANATYQEAERMLQARMPSIPLFFSRAIGGYAPKVASAKLTIFGGYDWASITLK
jgi:oligopeptide transport system substrate-binding protein